MPLMPPRQPHGLHFSTPAFEQRGDQLTDEQVRIQSSQALSLLIEAAAGAAKTTSLCLRICEVLASGTPPGQLLVLTFTATARTAVKRTLRFLGAGLVAHDAVRVETFDSYAAEVLRRMEQLPGSARASTLHTPEQAKPHVWAAIEAAADHIGERHRDDLALPSYGNDSYVGHFLDQADRLKGTLALHLNPPEQGDTPDYAFSDCGVEYGVLRVFRRYEEHRLGRGDGIPRFRMPLDATYDLARALLPEAELSPGEIPLGRYGWVFVDEMHDCNQAMFTILQALLQRKHVSFCAVGDRHQVIHQRHGADARFMGRDLDALLGRRIERLPLTLTFRYGKSLADWMSRFSRKGIESFHSLRTEVRALACRSAGSASVPGSPDELPQQEPACIQAIEEWRGLKTTRLNETAILLRHEAQSVLLENALHARGLAYKCDGFPSYLHRPEVLFVRTVFAIASGRLDTLGGAGTRALVPAALFEMTGARIIQEDQDKAHGSAADFLRDAGEQARASEAVLEHLFNGPVMQYAPKAVRRRLDLAIQVVRDSRGGDTCSFDAFLEALDMRRFALDVYVSPARRHAVLEHMKGLGAACAHHDSILDFFRSLQQQDEAQEQRGADREAGKVYSNRARVPTLTLARAAHVKGMEFGHVLLPYLEEGRFPDRDAPAADEVNLFYVAATRARERLTLLVDAERPSSFVAGVMPKAGPKP